MTVTTYTSASKGTLKIAEMVPEHISNAIGKLRAKGTLTESETATLAALEAELTVRPVQVQATA